MHKQTAAIISIIALSALSAHTVMASGFTYKDGDKYMKIGGRIQIQYHIEDPDDGELTDELFLRRLRPYVEASTHEDWKGMFQWDFGLGKVEPREVYMQYHGLENMLIRIGNTEFPFSREFTTSNKKQQLVERTFVGNSKRGTPDRQTGIHLHGNNLAKKLTWRAATVIASQAPDNRKLDYRTAISLYQDDDWSQGPMAGARVDYHPFGFMEFSQGDFDRKLKATIGISGFTWQNDHDTLDTTRSNDVERISAFEISGAVHGGGISVDAQYNIFASRLVDNGISEGLYKDSKATVTQYSVEGGYMVIPSRVELVAGYQVQDADGYDKAWTRSSVGLNYFVKKHNIKFQLTYQIGNNVDGTDGNDINEMFLQTQYVF